MLTFRGFSFIEVIVALLLLAIVAAAVGCALTQYVVLQVKLEAQLVELRQ